MEDLAPTLVGLWAEDDVQAFLFEAEDYKSG